MSSLQKSSSEYDMLILNGDFTKDYKQDTHKFLLFQIIKKKKSIFSCKMSVLGIFEIPLRYLN